MYSNLIEATTYCKTFLKDYFEEEQERSGNLIAMALQDAMFTKIQEMTLTVEDEAFLEAIHPAELGKIDTFLQEKLPMYQEILEEVVAEYVMTFVDLENTVVAATA